jgi:hypothetical protein
MTSTSESRVSTHLGKLAKRGLTASPMCVPGRAWCLTGAGLAASAMPVILDDLDKQVLAVLRSAPMGPVRLSRRVGICLLTAKRRARLLAEKGLVVADVRRFFSLTPAGREALGDEAAKVTRWVDVSRIMASTAPDVRERGGRDVFTVAERGRLGGMRTARRGQYEEERLAS